MSRLVRRVASTVLAASLLVRGAPASAQGIPVIDQAAVTQALADVNAVTQQVQQLAALLTQVQAIALTVGQAGAPAWLLAPAISAPSGSAATPYGDLAAASQRTMTVAQAAAAANQQLAGSIQAIVSSANGGPPSSSAVDFSSFVAARQWVQVALAAPATPALSGWGATRKARTLLAAQASANAYTLALSVGQQLAQTATRTQTLAEQVASASDLRGDVEANTTVMLAVHDTLTQIQLLMAALLAAEGATRMAALDPQSAAIGGSNGSTGIVTGP